VTLFNFARITVFDSFGDRWGNCVWALSGEFWIYGIHLKFCIFDCETCFSFYLTYLTVHFQTQMCLYG